VKLRYACLVQVSRIRIHANIASGQLHCIILRIFSALVCVTSFGLLFIAALSFLGIIIRQRRTLFRLWPRPPSIRSTNI
jgi:hypothetical protein